MVSRELASNLANFEMQIPHFVRTRGREGGKEGLRDGRQEGRRDDKKRERGEGEKERKESGMHTSKQINRLTGGPTTKH